MGLSDHAGWRRRTRRKSQPVPEYILLTRSFAILACSAALLSAGPLISVQSAAQSAPAKPAAPQAVVPIQLPPPPAPQLPSIFAGWVAAAAPQTVTDPAKADASNAAALEEYGFTGATLATYKRNGETVTLRAIGFQDASGAYGAYTFYRQNGWPKEEIASGAASNHDRVLFWKGNVFVDAQFSHIGPMSGSELRDLAGQITVPGGNRALPPPILANLPTASLDGQTTHYALGPAGYAGSGGVLPPDLVSFDRGAESITANYSLPSGQATLTIIDYPTPQMAAAMETKIRAYLQAGAHAQAAFPKPLQDSDQSSLEVRRSGPLVAVVSGDAIPVESHELVESVNYEATLANIPMPGESNAAKASRFLIELSFLILIGAVAALLLGIFFGGGRALYRVSRGKPVSAVFDEEFIRIDLREEQIVTGPAVDKPNPKG
jgi:hypothetical protein